MVARRRQLSVILIEGFQAGFVATAVLAAVSLLVNLTLFTPSKDVLAES